MIGRTVSHYRVLEQLGAGGMGVVYKAEDLKLGRMVALKMISDHLSDRAAIDRFEREARAASALNHPNISTIHEIDEESGRPFIVMELLEGQTLQKMLEKGALPADQLSDLAIEFADALAAAHDARIIHRDLKPANLFVTRSGHGKILDFGLAKLLPQNDESQTAARDLTASHATVGTLAYMSPEQKRGEPLDARTDLYSFGVVLREAAGRNAPPGLQTIIAKAVEEDRELRYQSAAEMRTDLKRLRQKRAPQRSSRLGLIGALAALVIVVAAIVWTALTRNKARSAAVQPQAAIQSLAVLPFKPLAAKQRDEALEIGIADTLIAKISNVRGITVRPLTAVRRYAGLEQDPIEAGRGLNVDAVLDGTIASAKDKIRVNARLLRVSDSAQLWAGQFDTSFADIFAVYDTISTQLTSELSLKLTPAEQRQLRKRDTDNAEAYRAYLLGRNYMSKLRRENLEKAVEYFKQAVALDPDYALAYVGLANVYMGLPIGADYPSTPLAERANAAATKAISIDPELADGYTALGIIKYWHDWNWPEAEKLYKRAIALNPNYSRAHAFYSLLLSSERRSEEAIREAHTAERLEPLWVQVNIITGQTLNQAGRYDEALEQLNRALEANRGNWAVQLMIGKAYEGKGMKDAAMNYYRASASASSGETEPLTRIGYLLATSGETAKARDVLTQLTKLSKERYVPPYNIAVLLAGLRRTDDAFRMLRRACADHDVRLVFIKVDPAWNGMRSDPRYRDVLTCMGIEP